MTTTAITGGFAVCQTRLGAKVHDPKDPGADLGPMFRQVVGTILRLADAHADRWLAIRGSHDIPVYGFERIARPAAAGGQHAAPARGVRDRVAHVGDAWREMLAPETAATVLALGRRPDAAADAVAKAATGAAGGEARRPTTRDGRGRRRVPLPGRGLGAPHLRPRSSRARERRTRTSTSSWRRSSRSTSAGSASFVIETPRPDDGRRPRTSVERQARDFELAKPYLVDRWNARAGVRRMSRHAAARSRILIPVANPRTAAELIRLGAALLEPRTAS